MTFVFDECIPEAFAIILRSLGENVTHQVLRGKRGQKDKEMIPELGARGWILITADTRIKKRSHERAMLKEHKLSTVYFAPFFFKLTMWQKAQMILKSWKRITEQIIIEPPGTIARVKDYEGNLDILPE